MSLGILGVRGMGSAGALGADVSPPKAWCWKAAGYPWGAAFDTCHARNYQRCIDAKRWPGTKDGDQCVYTLDLGCGCPTSPPSGPPAGGGGTTSAPAGSALTMGNKTSDPRVSALQAEINQTLTKNGYAAIGTDGKLGPGTCGAAREADKFGAGLMAKYGLASVCTSFTAPVRSGGFVSPGGGGGGAPLTPPDTLSSGTTLGMDTKTVLLIVAVAAGAYVFFGKKKPGAGK